MLKAFVHQTAEAVDLSFNPWLAVSVMLVFFIIAAWDYRPYHLRRRVTFKNVSLSRDEEPSFLRERAQTDSHLLLRKESVDQALSRALHTRRRSHSPNRTQLRRSSSLNKLKLEQFRQSTESAVETKALLSSESPRPTYFSIFILFQRTINRLSERR